MKHIHVVCKIRREIKEKFGLQVSYNDGTCQFTVHSFPISKSYWSYKMKSRKQKDIQFLAPDIEEALKWIYAFESQRCFINHSPLLPMLSKKQGSRIDVHDSPPSFYVGRVMLVIINPRSGHGRALKIYSSEVEPILKVCCLTWYYTYLLTQMVQCVIFCVRSDYLLYCIFNKWDLFTAGRNQAECSRNYWSTSCRETGCQY